MANTISNLWDVEPLRHVFITICRRQFSISTMGILTIELGRGQGGRERVTERESKAGQ